MDRRGPPNSVGERRIDVVHWKVRGLTMLKKLSTLLFLCALCMWAANFWTTKPFTDWDDKEVQKVLTDSPWVGRVTMSSGGGGGAPAAVAGGGGGGRRG